MPRRHKPAIESQPSEQTLKDRSKFNIPVRFLRRVHPEVSESTEAQQQQGKDGDPSCPVLVFINPSSGGKAGPLLHKLLRGALGDLQVLDISQKESRPDVVLKALWEELDEMSERGDRAADHIKRHLRVVAAGGDGTIAWVLSTIRDLGLQPPPPVAPMPLGTGNGMSVNFGWGKKLRPRDLQGRAKADKELEAICKAEVRPIDGWNIDMIAGDCNLIDELPHSMHKVDDESAKEAQNGCRATGRSWYYMTVGLDAEVSWRFHKLRDTRPWLSPTRKTNIMWYFWSTCASGWFCCPTPLNKKMALRQKDAKSGEWRDVHIPDTVEAIIFINLQSYTGSRDMWGLHDRAEDQRRGHQVPIYDDGLMEVIGLESAGKSFLALTNLWRTVHGCRLAQASEFELQLSKPGGGDTHLRIDGEPWRQKLPDSTSAQPPLRVTIKVAPPGRVLVNKEGLPKKNRSTRRAADAAGTSKSGESFAGDHETVVAMTPRPDLPEVEAESPGDKGLHLLKHPHHMGNT